MKPLKTKTYDIAGNSFFRVVKLGLLNKIIPIGNFKQGTGTRPALTLLMLHYFGRPLFWFGVRYERLFRFLIKVVKRS